MSYRLLWSVLLTLVLVTATVLVGMGQEPPPPEEPEAFALLNGRPIGLERFERNKSSVLNYYQQVYAQFGMDIRMLMQGPRGRLFELDLELVALDAVLTEGLVNEEAERRAITVSEEALDEAFQVQYTRLLEREGLTEEQLAGALLAQGSTLQAFKDDGRAQIAQQLIRDAVARAVAGPVEPTEAELLAYFETHRDAYDIEAEVQASHILVEEMEKAQQILDELAEGADFAALAREHSTCPSSERGGALGWFGRGRMVPEFEEAAFALQVGELSGLVQTDFGVHIILVTDRRDAKEALFDEVREELREDLRENMINDLFWEWVETTLAQAEVEVREPVLNAWFIQDRDIDLGIAAFEELRDAPEVTDRHLTFIIGSLYQDRMEQGEATLAAADEDAVDDITLDIAEIEAQVEADRLAALSAYQEALSELGEIDEIIARIETLEAKAPAATQ